MPVDLAGVNGSYECQFCGGFTNLGTRAFFRVGQGSGQLRTTYLHGIDFQSG